MHEPSTTVVLNFRVTSIFFPRVFFDNVRLRILTSNFYHSSFIISGGKEDSQLEKISLENADLREILKGCGCQVPRSLDRTKIRTNNNEVIAVSCDSWIIHARPLSACVPQWFQLGGGSTRVAWLNNDEKGEVWNFMGGGKFKALVMHCCRHLWFTTHESSALYSFESWTFLLDNLRLGKRYFYFYYLR